VSGVYYALLQGTRKLLKPAHQSSQRHQRLRTVQTWNQSQWWYNWHWWGLCFSGVYPAYACHLGREEISGTSRHPTGGRHRFK